MANLSDAFGTISVERVGRELLEFLKDVQGTEGKAYYKLIEIDDLNNAKVDKNNNLEMDFNTFGRWNYFTNVEGFLGGNWMKASEYTPKSHEVAYKKFIKALNDRNGKITIEYTDSDSAMDWIGTGMVEVTPNNGGVSVNESFDEHNMTLELYCKLYQADEEEALEYMYGDEVSAEYMKYVKQCEKDGKEFKGAAEWFDNIYEEE